MMRESRLIFVRASDFLLPNYGQRPKRRPERSPVVPGPQVARPRTAVKPTRVPLRTGAGISTVRAGRFASQQRSVAAEERRRATPLPFYGNKVPTNIPSKYNPDGTLRDNAPRPIGVSFGFPSSERQAAIRRTAEQQASAVFDIARRPEAEKLSAVGINQDRAKLYDWMKSTGFKVQGTVDGRLYVPYSTPETLKQLQDFGVVEYSVPAGKGFKILLNISEEEYRKQFPQYDFIKSGGDVRQAIKEYQKYERQSTADLAEQAQEQEGRQQQGGQSPFRMQPQVESMRGRGDGRSDAVMDLVRQGVTDPNEISQYMSYDDQGNQIGDITPEEARQIITSQRPQINLPSYSADPFQFIQSYWDNFKSLRDAGYLRDEAQEYLSQDEEDSRYIYSQSLEDAEERRKSQIKFDADLNDLERNREVTAHEKSLAITKLGDARAEVVARDQAEQDEEVSRRVAGRLGITQGGAGVKWLRDIVRKSSEHLSYIIQRGGMEEAGLVREHADNMAGIDHNARVRYDKAWGDYQTEKTAVTKQRLLDKKATRSERARIDKEYNDKLFEIDKWKGENYLKEIQRSEDRAFDKYKLDRQERIEGAKTKAQTATDRIKFARDTSSLIANSSSYKEYDEVKTRTAVSQETLSLYKQGYVDRSVMANALTKNFEKILDPTSVVREGEFKMTEALQPYLNQKGWIGLMQKLTEGGTGVSDKVFEDMVTFAQAATRMQMKRAQQAAAPFLWQVQEYNNLLPGNPISLQMAVPEGLPVGDWNAYGSWAGDYYSQGGDAPSFDYTKEDTAPPVNSYVQTTVTAGVITDYGSAVSPHGLDISAQAGTVVRAPMGGVIEDVIFNPTWRGNPFSDASDFNRNKRSKSEKYKAQKAQNGGFGNSVVVKLDNGFKVRISHLSYTVVQSMKGQRIEHGSELGRIGNTGMTYGKTGNHVDIEMHDDKGKRLNPRQIAAFIGAGGGQPIRDPANDYIPVAHASDYSPEEKNRTQPNIPEPEVEEPQPQAPPQRTGQFARPRGMQATPFVPSAKILGTFRDIRTGEILRPTRPSDVNWYKSHPQGFDDLEAPRTKKSAPQKRIAGGKRIVKLSAKRTVELPKKK